MYPFGPNDDVPPKCRICGHLSMQHTRTPEGKRCIGNHWRCKCTERPLSMMVTREMLEAARATTCALRNR
jgi:hypothetical protein